MNTRESFLESVPRLIQSRTSCRTFVSEELPATLLGEMDVRATTLLPAHPEAGRFVCFDRREAAMGKLFATGTYGLIRNSRYFMGLVVERKEEERFLALGRVLEELVLYATHLGLASCWIGGVFDRKGFAAQLGIAPEEDLPVVVALGHAAERRSLADRVTRWGSKGDKRKAPQELFRYEDASPACPEELRQPIQEALSLARLAPSASNRQPWRVVVDGRVLHLFLKRDSLYQKLMPQVDLQMVDMGIFLSHLELGLRHHGMAYQITHTPQAPPETDWSFLCSLKVGDSE